MDTFAASYGGYYGNCAALKLRVHRDNLLDMRGFMIRYLGSPSTLHDENSGYTASTLLLRVYENNKHQSSI